MSKKIEYSGGLRPCSWCKRYLNITEFSSNKAKWDGLNCYCKECNSLYYEKLKTKLTESYLENRRQKQRDRDTLRKIKVIQWYGRICACCEEDKLEFLTIDHINGGGHKHQKEIGAGKLYRWLIKNSMPEGFRVLCINCNFSLGHYRYCPHKEDTSRFSSILEKLGNR